MGSEQGKREWRTLLAQDVDGITKWFFRGVRWPGPCPEIGSHRGCGHHSAVTRLSGAPSEKSNRAEHQYRTHINPRIYDNQLTPYRMKAHRSQAKEPYRILGRVINGSHRANRLASRSTWIDAGFPQYKYR